MLTQTVLITFVLVIFHAFAFTNIEDIADDDSYEDVSPRPMKPGTDIFVDESQLPEEFPEGFHEIDGVVMDMSNVLVQTVTPNSTEYRLYDFNPQDMRNQNPMLPLYTRPKREASWHFIFFEDPHSLPGSGRLVLLQKLLGLTVKAGGTSLRELRLYEAFHIDLGGNYLDSMAQARQGENSQVSQFMNGTNDYGDYPEDDDDVLDETVGTEASPAAVTSDITTVAPMSGFDDLSNAAPTAGNSDTMVNPTSGLEDLSNPAPAETTPISTDMTEAASNIQEPPATTQVVPPASFMNTESSDASEGNPTTNYVPMDHNDQSSTPETAQPFTAENAEAEGQDSSVIIASPVSTMEESNSNAGETNYNAGESTTPLPLPSNTALYLETNPDSFYSTSTSPTSNAEETAASATDTVTEGAYRAENNQNEDPFSDSKQLCDGDCEQKTILPNVWVGTTDVAIMVETEAPFTTITPDMGATSGPLEVEVKAEVTTASSLWFMRNTETPSTSLTEDEGAVYPYPYLRGTSVSDQSDAGSPPAFQPASADTSNVAENMDGVTMSQLDIDGNTPTTGFDNPTTSSTNLMSGNEREDNTNYGLVETTDLPLTEYAPSSAPPETLSPIQDANQEGGTEDMSTPRASSAWEPDVSTTAPYYYNDSVPVSDLTYESTPEPEVEEVFTKSAVTEDSITELQSPASTNSVRNDEHEVKPADDVTNIPDYGEIFGNRRRKRTIDFQYHRAQLQIDLYKVMYGRLFNRTR